MKTELEEAFAQCDEEGTGLVAIKKLKVGDRREDRLNLCSRK